MTSIRNLVNNTGTVVGLSPDLPAVDFDFRKSKYLDFGHIYPR